MTKAAGKLKVALVITELDVGGAEQCLTNLALGLDPARFETAVLVLAPHPAKSQSALVDRLQQGGIPIQFLGCSNRWRLGRAVAQLRQQLVQLQPDIVQSMLFHANVVTGLALRQQVDAVWCAGIRVADPSRWRQLLERRIINRAASVVCVSQLVADYAVARMGLSGVQLTVIPNGVDVAGAAARDPVSLTKLGMPDNRRTITCVAPLAKQKGIDQLIHAASHMLPALRDHDLLLVGDGPQEAHLRRLARQSPVAARIHFAGWQNDIGGILQASDLMVLPSRWEGMPNVLLEAMACALPVVCTQVEGVLEVLGPLGPSQTVPAGSPQLLAEQVVKILSDRALAGQLAAANRARVASEFSLSSMLDRYETLYRAVSSAR